MHPLDFRILLSFARNAPTHGYAVLQALERNPDVPDLPYPANFYRRIRDLRDQGWLVEVDPPSESPSDDRPRKFFSLTDLGREQMRREGSRLTGLVREAGDLIGEEGVKETPGSKRFVRIYARLARGVLPTDFFNEFGADLIEAFEDRLQRGPAIREFLPALIDLVGEAIRLRLRAARGGFTGIRDDANLALRGLRRDPIATAGTAVLLLAGVAVATTFFTIQNALQLRPMGFEHSERLVRIFQVRPENRTLSPDVDRVVRAALADLDHVEGVGMFQDQQSRIVREDGTRVTEWSIRADPSTVALLRPALSQGTLPAVVGAVAVQPGLLPSGGVGSPVEVDDTAHTVQAVLGEGVGLGRGGAVWIVEDLAGLEQTEVVARLSPGVGFEQFSDRLEALSAALISEGQLSAGTVLLASKGAVDRLQGVGPIGLIGTLAGILVLVVLAANAASLLTARAIRRRGELAVRTALGASRGRLFRASLIETVVLVIPTLFLAVPLSTLLLKLVFSVRLAGTQLASVWPAWMTFSPDVRVVLFAQVAAVGVAAIASLAPAMRAAAVDPIDGLRSASVGASTNGDQRRWSRALAIGQLAGVSALILLTLIFRASASMSREQLVRPGVDRLITIGASFDSADPLDEEVDEWRAGAARVLRGMQGVTLAEEGYPRTLRGGLSQPRRIREAGADTSGMGGMSAVSPNWFELQGLGVLTGDLTGASRDVGVGVVISSTLAQARWPDGEAIGRALEVVLDDGEAVPAFVRAVVESPRVPRGGVATEVSRAWLLTTDVGLRADLRLVVRTELDPHQATPSIVEALRGVDPDVLPGRPTYPAELATVEADLMGKLFGSLLAIGLPVALLGLYALLSREVLSRRRELGIRAVLGAAPSNLVGQVARSGLRTGLGGALAGILLVLPSIQLIRPFIFGIPVLAPGVYFTATALVLLLTLAAAIPPALTAARSNPLAELRAQ